MEVLDDLQENKQARPQSKANKNFGDLNIKKPPNKTINFADTIVWEITFVIRISQMHTESVPMDSMVNYI